ncbi:MAG: isoprenyl transferase [Deltaproteobacteria bacterium]|nr:isoprenyl transferase [Deltaproteobacteria bacterium]
MSDAVQMEHLSSVPRHVAIIMDGNGRWAQSRGLKRIEGHKAGAKSVRAVVEESRRLGIEYLTLFSFSTENWQRSKDEVDSLMQLFKQYLDSELSDLLKNDIRLRAVGDLGRLPSYVRVALERNIESTKSNKALELVLAISYGAREEILAAAKSIATKVKDGKLDVRHITVDDFSSSLWTSGIPDPDLLIRTSGEMRVSNFLLWQIAYSEIVVTEELWPDFDKGVFLECIARFQQRERRFGLTKEQIELQKNGGGSTSSKEADQIGVLSAEGKAQIGLHLKE